jgi:hypothetical protein
MWHVIPDQKIDACDVMQNFIEFESVQDILEGALIYRIQSKYTKYDRLIHDKSKSVQLLVAWRVEHTKEFCVRALLVEHDGKLDENNLRKLYQKYWHSLEARVDPTKNNWLLNDSIVLATAVAALNGGYRWDIFLSGVMNNLSKRPIWIDVER